MSEFNLEAKRLKNRNKLSGKKRLLISVGIMTVIIILLFGGTKLFGSLNNSKNDNALMNPSTYPPQMNPYPPDMNPFFDYIGKVKDSNIDFSNAFHAYSTAALATRKHLTPDVSTSSCIVTMETTLDTIKNTSAPVGYEEATIHQKELISTMETLLSSVNRDSYKLNEPLNSDVDPNYAKGFQYTSAYYGAEYQNYSEQSGQFNDYITKIENEKAIKTK